MVSGFDGFDRRDEMGCSWQMRGHRVSLPSTIYHNWFVVTLTWVVKSLVVSHFIQITRRRDGMFLVLRRNLISNCPIMKRLRRRISTQWVALPSRPISKTLCNNHLNVPSPTFSKLYNLCWSFRNLQRTPALRQLIVEMRSENVRAFCRARHYF